MSCDYHTSDYICPKCKPDFWAMSDEEANEYAVSRLRAKLIESKHLYYCVGKSNQSDGEYDAREHSLRVLSPNDVFFSMVGCPKCGNQKSDRTINYKDIESKEAEKRQAVRDLADKEANTIVYSKNGRKDSIKIKRPKRSAKNVKK
jgi:ssDNA-binding Zn-finger/Zn-ribbon topoisomerase 1